MFSGWSSDRSDTETHSYRFTPNLFILLQVENRAAKSKRVMEFARSMFHNHFSLPSEKEEKSRHENAANGIQQAQVLMVLCCLTILFTQFLWFQDAFGPRRQYKRKDAGPDDEKTRVRMTLLEYGNNGLFSSNTPPPIPTAINAQSSSSALAEKNKRRPEVIATGEDSMTASEVLFVSARCPEWMSFRNIVCVFFVLFVIFCSKLLSR